MACAAASLPAALFPVNPEKNIVSCYSSSSSSSSLSSLSSPPITIRRLFRRQPLSIVRLLPPLLPWRFQSPLPPRLNAPFQPSSLADPNAVPKEAAAGDASGEECAAEEETAAPSPSSADITAETDRRFFVGSIPPTMDDAALATLFGDHGTVERAQVIMHKWTGKSRQFGFVTMKTAEEAHRAIQELDGWDMGEQKLRVKAIDKPFVPPPPFIDSPHKVFVANVPYLTTNTRFRDFFSQHVPLVCARVGQVRRKHKFFGMLTFSSEEHLQAAVALSGIWLDGKKLVINRAQPWQLPHCIMLMRYKDGYPPPRRQRRRK